MTTKQLEIFEMADQFIAMTNAFVDDSDQPLGRVGAAIRYAAARFNAHEAYVTSDNLASDKANALSWYADQYRKTLDENLDDHIEKGYEND